MQFIALSIGLETYTHQVNSFIQIQEIRREFLFFICYQSHTKEMVTKKDNIFIKHFSSLFQKLK